MSAILKKSRRRIKHLAVHCSATMPHQNFRAADIDRWHRARGWNGNGYHYVICRDGEIELGRDVDIIPSQAAGYNKYAIGICLIGGLGSDMRPAAEYTRAQWSSLNRLLIGLREIYPDAEILGHRDFPGVNKACPSFDVKDWCHEQGIAA